MRDKILRDAILTILVAGLFLVAAFVISHDKVATVEKILIGFFYSIIFFFLIEDLPTKRKQRRYRKLIIKELTYTLIVLDNIIDTLKLKKSTTYLKQRAKILIKTSPQKITVHDVHRSESFSEAHRKEIANYPSVGAYLEISQKKIKQVKRRLEKFTFFVESRLLEIIIEIEKFHLSWISEILKAKHKDEVQPDSIIPDLKLIVNLSGTLKKYLRKYKKES